jgi:methionyl-tRNA synthetase
MPWGIQVPGDPTHVMYVWFDALFNYISTLGWPENEKEFDDFWPGYQVAGKDNLRQQAAVWQAMLASAGLPFSKQVFIHGFVTLNGKKISKSLGNTINPVEVAKKYGTDALRYYLLAKINPTEDSDFSFGKFEEVYNGDLANGLGNLVSRVAKLCEKSGFDFTIDTSMYQQLDKDIQTSLDEYKFDEVLKGIWVKISETDKFINENEPWKLSGDKLKQILDRAVLNIKTIAFNLSPFLPQTADAIQKQFNGNKIKSQKPLFPRL